jgi:nucleotide-binding universal stress UspA family protein
MAEKILVTLDGSQFAEAALHYVENMVDRLVPQEKPEVTLLMVVNPHVEYINVEGGTVPVVEKNGELEKEKSADARYLDKAAGALRDRGVIVNTKLVESNLSRNAAEAIIDAEKEIGADLVIMSTHGRSGISRWAIGSVTEKVLRGGSVPVLMVRCR